MTMKAIRKLVVVLGVVALAGCATAPKRATQPGPTPAPAAQTPATAQSAGTTVEEYALGPDSQGGPANPASRQALTPALLEKRQRWREPSAAKVAAYGNRLLTPAGYRLVPKGSTLDLYEGDRAVFAGLEFVNAVYPAATSKGFFLHGAKDAAPVLLSTGGPLPQDPQAPLTQGPVYAGDDVVSLHFDHNTQSVQVIKNNKLVHFYHYPGPVQPASPSALVKGFTVWDGRWVLETMEAQVIVDGQSLNQQLGYDQIFSFQLLAGKPFFFFSKGGKIGVSYNGKVLPQHYEQVPHYACCDSTIYNPRGNPWLIHFYGLRDGKWHYVELGVYD